MTVAVVALGSNIGDRLSHLTAAAAGLRALEGVALTAASRLYETAPVGGPDQQGPFLNAAMRLETRLSARALLDALHGIEAERERVREVRWGPRTLDLDLLLFGDAISDDPHLTLPHPRMHERRFVMAPAADVAPDLRHPTLGLSLATIAAGLPETPGDLYPVAERWVDGL